MFRIIFPALPFLIAVIVPTLAALAPEAPQQRGLASFMTAPPPSSGFGGRADR